MSLIEKLQKQCKIKEAAVLSSSKLFSKRKYTSTKVPMLNVALSGSVDGGFGAGLTLLAGPSKHFKCVCPNTPIEVYLEEER